MFKGLGNIAQLLNQARNMGGQMESVNEELATKTVIGSAGGDMVKVHANGLGLVTRVEIDDILKEKQDLEMITDLLPIAFNDALTKSKKLHMEAMQSMTGGMELPAGLDNTLKQVLGGGVLGTSDDAKPTDPS